MKDGNVLLVMNGKQRERFIILFSDVLLICKPLAAPRGSFKYELESGFSIAELVLKQDSVRGSKVTASFQLQIITTPDKSCLQFNTYTDEDKTQWLNVFQKCLKDITEEHRSAIRNTIGAASLGRQSSIQNAIGDAFGISLNLKKHSKLMPSGLSNSLLRKQAAVRKAAEDIFTDDWVDPDQVDIQGMRYKRGISATGHVYY